MIKQILILTIAFSILFLSIGCTNNKLIVQNDDTHKKAATELLTIMNMEKLLDQSIQTALGIQIQQNPALENYKETMQEFFNKYMSWDYLKDEFVKIYMEEFTENELRDMIEFYKTDTGKKTLERLPILLQKGAQLGQKSVQNNLGELEKMIEKRKAELEK